MGTHVEFTWVGVVTLVASSSVVSALLTQALIWWRDAKGKGEDRRLATIYLTAALKNFAREAYALVMASERFEESHGAAGNLARNLPEPPCSLENIDWKVLGADRTGEFLEFVSQVEQLRAFVDTFWEMELDNGYASDVVRQHAVRAGLRALQIVAGLEGRHVGDPVSIEGLGHLELRLERKRIEYEQRRANEELVERLIREQQEASAN